MEPRYDIDLFEGTSADNFVEELIDGHMHAPVEPVEVIAVQEDTGDPLFSQMKLVKDAEGNFFMQVTFLEGAFSLWLKASNRDLVIEELRVLGVEI